MAESNDFEQVDLSTFFDSQDTDPVHDEKAEMLTTKQKELIQEVMPQIKAVDPEKAQSFEERLKSLEALAQAVAKFPSLLERHELIGGTRTPTSLIDSLIDHQDAGDDIGCSLHTAQNLILRNACLRKDRNGDGFTGTAVCFNGKRD